MPHDGGKARAGLPLRLMRFTARSPGRTHGWQAGTSQMCGRRDLPDMSGIDPVAAPEPPHGPSFPPMCRPCGHTAEHDRSQVAITQKRQRSAPHCSWGWPQQMIRDVLPVSGEDDKPDGIGKRMSGRSRKYAAKLCYHTTVGCSSNFLICVCDLVCRGKTRVKRCGEAPSIFSGKTQVSHSAAKRKIAKQKAKRKSSMAARQVPATATPRTPSNKGDCIETAQAFYARAQTISRQKKQSFRRNSGWLFRN